ncbi:tetratricopeptide repeat protein [Photobacterium halotolerans]|uniref:cellulose synthase subunit BcsC-related outer membrane protein n=1 Tax=Photobacterium halotolerans TaxID=265726 RepID=UPI0013723D3B|nr:cellulose synthase subunit BcsC-related outer membrane protein [Photobacterium halotolerans]NAX47908.1 tetratricopeptide repeat protein [Photobacterium halotolerans]
MSVTVSLNTSILIALGLSAGAISLSAYAGIVPATPLTPQQLEQVYQPVDSVTTFSAVPSDSNSVDFLVNQIELATALGRDDIVESALERLLAIDSQHPDGLYYQARLLIKQNQLQQAQEVSNQLKAGSPQSVQLKALNDLIAINGRKKAELQQARLLVRAGRYEQALKAYDALFPNGMPSAELQLEYLEAEGSLSERWESVKQGLEQLNAAYPGVPAFQLALANHIRRRDAADPWILATYRQLALRSDIGIVAANAWLRALDQQPISAQVAEQYAIVASYFPSDTAISRANRNAQARWETEQALRKDPTYLAKLQGLALIEQGVYPQARKQLEYALTTRPDDPDILGGLGMVYLRQGQQGKALEYFKQAQQLDADPDNVSKWQSLVEASSYWAYLDEGDALRQKGQLSQAERAYRKAMPVNAAEPYAYLKLAELYQQQQKFAAAEQAYRQALQRDPGNAQIVRGLVNLTLESQGLAAAIAFAEQLPPARRQQIRDTLLEMKTQLVVQQLSSALVENDTQAAEQFAIQLLQLDPSSPWQRRDIADALVAAGQRSRADALMQQWAADSRDPEMQFAYGLYLSQAGRDDEAVAVMSRVPAARRSEAMQRNLLRLRLDQSLADLPARYQANPDAVRQQLHALAQQYASQPAVLARLAMSWSGLGERQQAEKIYRQLTPSDSWPENARLGYGELMIELAHFSAFDLWLAQQGQARVNGEQDAVSRTELDTLNTRRLLAEAAILTEQRQFRRAQALYQNVLTDAKPVPEPYRTDARLGVLQTSAALGDAAVYQPVSEQLYASRSLLTARQLMAAAPVMNRQGEYDKARELNRLLSQRPDADAMDYRNSMALAMDNQQWALAGQRGYQALNADRIEKSADIQAAKAQSPDLRTLYQEADDYWLTRNVKADIDRLRDRSDGHIMIGWDYSARDGENKASQVPIEARIPIEQWDGHLLVRADYVSLDSGDLDYYDKFADSNAQYEPLRARDTGLALGIGWQAENWQADIGTTPLGFDQSTWVGGVTLEGDIGDFGVSGTLSRRPETSSVLSYAGMSVPRSAPVDGNSGTINADPAGTQWGGVVSTGVKLNASWDIGGPYGFWSSVQHHLITGEKVADNTRLALLGGGYYKLIATDDQRLSIGTNLLYFDYDKNLSEYTLGSGGYYSPQRYVSLSLPVNYYGRYNSSWSYLVSASVSNSWSREDAPYQSDGESDTGGGFGYSLEGALEKRVSSRWYVGVAMDLQRSDFYEPNHFMLYTRFTFNDRWQPIDYPPTVPSLYSDFD